MRKVKTANNPYCGPAVLSILTGKDTDECASIIISVTGRHDIKEIQVPELLKTLDKLKFKYILVDSDCSLYSLMIGIHKTDGMYIVVVPQHVVALEVKDKQVYFCDNHTKEPINGAASARLGQRVMLCYRTEAKPDPVLLETKIQVEIGSYSLYINRLSTYQNPEDNTSKYIGTIQFNNLDELKTIRDELLRKI